MAAVAIMNFENRLPFNYYWTDRHQIWWECWESDIERKRCIKNCIITKIQDGGGRHLAFRNSVDISLLLDRFLPNFVWMWKLRHITQISHQKSIVTRIQDGGGHHLEFRKSVAISLLLNQSSPKLVGMLKISHRTQILHQNCIITRIQDGGGCHLEFRNSVAIS